MDPIVIGGKADALAKRIARAEGFGVAGALPTRINNPGDMKLGDRGWGIEQGKTIYLKADWNADLQDKTDGCSALRRECGAILSGFSHVYKTDWTFQELAQEWTGGDNSGEWCSIVCGGLAMTPEMTLQQYIEGGE